MKILQQYLTHRDCLDNIIPAIIEKYQSTHQIIKLYVEILTELSLLVEIINMTGFWNNLFKKITYLLLEIMENRKLSSTTRGNLFLKLTTYLTTNKDIYCNHKI